MELTPAFFKNLNTAYSRLEQKQSELKKAFLQRDFDIQTGWYNGHYERNQNGGWDRNTYPIPEIAVMNLCDIEISFDKLTVTAKLSRKQALGFAYETLAGFSFEVYGVENYLSDHYREGGTIEELKRNIAQSSENEIGFSFSFSWETSSETLLAFTEMLKNEGFYY